MLSVCSHVRSNLIHTIKYSLVSFIEGKIDFLISKLLKLYRKVYIKGIDTVPFSHVIIPYSGLSGHCEIFLIQFF